MAAKADVSGCSSTVHGMLLSHRSLVSVWVAALLCCLLVQGCYLLWC